MCLNAAADPPDLPRTGGPRIPGCSALEGLHAHLGRLLIGTPCSPQLAHALLMLRLHLWNVAAGVRNAGASQLHTSDWHSLQQQVDLCEAAGWPNPQPSLPLVPAFTAETFGFAYQPTAAQWAAAQQLLQQAAPQTAPSTAAGLPAASQAAASQPPAAGAEDPEPLLYEEDSPAAGELVSGAEAALALSSDEQLMEQAVDRLPGVFESTKKRCTAFVRAHIQLA